MITWNKIYFNNNSRYSIELTSLIHDYIIVFIISILIIIILILLYVKINKNYSLILKDINQLEIIWTIVPAIILYIIFLPSIKRLFNIETCNYCGMTVKIMGHQWYWSYQSIIGYFDSYIQKSNYNRLLETDNNLIIPRNTPIKTLISSADVIHSWTIPSLGVKIDAIPGRVNQLCFTVKKLGVLYGQCSEICGANHRFIPIIIECVNIKNYIKL